MLTMLNLFDDNKTKKEKRKQVPLLIARKKLL